MLKKIKNGYKRFIKRGGILGYLKRTKHVKAICVIIGTLLWYHTKTTPDMNILEEVFCDMFKIANLAAFIFVEDDIYKTFIGEP